MTRRWCCRTSGSCRWSNRPRADGQRSVGRIRRRSAPRSTACSVLTWRAPQQWVRLRLLNGCKRTHPGATSGSRGCHHALLQIANEGIRLPPVATAAPLTPGNPVSGPRCYHPWPACSGQVTRLLGPASAGGGMDIPVWHRVETEVTALTMRADRPSFQPGAMVFTPRSPGLSPAAAISAGPRYAGQNLQP